MARGLDSVYGPTPNELTARQDLYQVAASLVGQTQEANENAVTYSIAALRRMCEDKTIRSTNTVEFLRKHCNLDIVERCREVASCLYNLALWVDAREHIIKSGIFDCISSLAKSYDEETARFALGALANIANDTRYHDVVAGKDGVVSTILALTQSFTLSIARESCRALANVLSSMVAQMIVLQQEEGMKSLIHLSTLQDYECALSAAVAFRKLSANSHSHESFFSQDGAAVNAIVNLTCRQETSIQLQSADALQHIASNPYFQLVFVEMGGVRAAIELSSSLHDTDVKTIAFGIVRQLSIPMSLKQSLVASGIVGIMSDCVNSDAQDDDIDSTEDLLYQCAASIANMAEHAQNKLVLVQMGVINCLVSLCKSKSAKVKRETARAFSLLTSAPDNNIPTKVIPNILDLLHSQDEGTARDGAATISNIVYVDTENSSLVGGALCGIPPLVLLLSSPYESCQMNSCKCLCRLTAGITFHENKTSVFSNGGLTPLIQLCSSSNQGVALMAVMVLVNLSSLEGYQIKFVEQNSIPPLQQLLFSDCPLTRKNTTMVLCNLASHHSSQDYVMKQVGLFPLYELIKNDQDSECQVFAIMTICNLGRQTNCESILEAPGGLLQLLMAMVNGESPNLRRASLMTLYNLSSCESSHALYVKYGAVQEIVASIVNSDDVLCRRFALMILANLSCSDKTRVAVKKGGGLQAAVSSLKDDDFTTQRFACICLANMSNDTATSSQVVVHGGLQPLLGLCQMYDDADKTQECASMCISNLVANQSEFVDNNSSTSSSIFISFAIANMTNNRNEIGQDGVAVLVELAGIGNLHSRCLALSSLRRLSLLKGHRDRMLEENFIETLVSACRTTETEIQREVASCLCNLSLSSSHHIRIAQSAIPELMTLAKKSDDVDVMRLSLVALGNLSENVDTHPFFVRSVAMLDTVLDCLICEELDIKREAARVICNLLNSPDTHPRIIQSGLDSLLLLSTDNCEECRYFAAFSLQKLTQISIHSHHTLINNLKPILSMLRGEQKKTQKHSAIALRNLSASKEDRYELFAQGVPNSMVDLMKENDKDLCLLAIATLRHLSTSDRIKEGFSSSGIMQSVIRCCTRANEVDIKCQTAGLFANLSEHRECQPTIIASGIVQAINSLITIEHDEIWQDCSRTLANLCSHEGKQANIHRQGVLQTLAKLGKSTSDVCERYVAIAMRFMSSCVEVQQSHAKSYFPYLEFSASNLLDFQRAAAAAFASMSLNDTGKSLVLKKGGVKSILQLCIHLDLAVRRDAVHSVANFVASPNFCQYVVIEGGVETIKAVALSNNNVEVLRDASRALSSLSTDDATKGIMVSHEMTKVLCKLAKSPDSATQQFASLALSNLCSGTREEKELVVKQGVLRVLLFLLRFPDLEVERCASLAIAGLSLGSDRNKAELIDNGFIYPLVDTIAYPDARIRQCALLALNGISLGEQETKGGILKDEKCLSSLMNLIKSDSDDESMNSGMYMLGTLAFNGDIRDTIIALDGCLQRIVDKTSTGSIEIKRAAAYFLSILSESLNYHDNLQQVGGLEAAVRLSSLVDEECQDYGTLMLAFLANNKAFQVPLVNMGAIRPLVSCCSTSTSSSSSHFAGVALVRLAENYMNHIAIAEEGGLSVLLRLGRMGGKKNLQYQASLSITKMAKQAASLVEKN